jgi:hypothetical protein
MAEAGVPESTMLALMGHMSRAMLAAKALRLAPKPVFSDQVPTKVPTIEIPAKIQ